MRSSRSGSHQRVGASERPLIAVRPVFPQGSSGLTSSSNGYLSRRKGSLCRLLLRACSGTDVAASPLTWALWQRAPSRRHDTGFETRVGRSREESFRLRRLQRPGRVVHVGARWMLPAGLTAAPPSLRRRNAGRMAAHVLVSCSDLPSHSGRLWRIALKADMSPDCGRAFDSRRLHFRFQAEYWSRQSTSLWASTASIVCMIDTLSSRGIKGLSRRPWRRQRATSSA
jgi:hypothetical protein